MNVLYTRISTVQQKSDRQTQNAENYKYVVEDKCSGAIPFFERNGGKQIKKLITDKKATMVTVHQIDRLGRNLMDILNTIDYFNKKGVCIHFIQQGIRTLDDDGKENQISKLIISKLI